MGVLLGWRALGSFGIIPSRRLGSEVLMTQNYVWRSNNIKQLLDNFGQNYFFTSLIEKRRQLYFYFHVLIALVYDSNRSCTSPACL